MLIGICGKSGSGKSTLAKEILNNYKNSIHIDIDKIGHDVLKLEKVKCDLISSFGLSILKNNEINRKKLSEIVFKSESDMEILTQITWKYMELKIDKIITKNKEKMIILDWQLLPKTKFFDMCDKRILIDIPYSIRLKRVVLRDCIDEDKFLLRENASIDYSKYKFDLVINDNDFKKIERLCLYDKSTISW